MDFLFVLLDAVRIGCAFSLSISHELNSLGHCIRVHHGNISAAAGVEPGDSGLSVNHATNELFRRQNIHQIYKYILENIN